MAILRVYNETILSFIYFFIFNFFCSVEEVYVAFLRGVKTFWHGHCSNVYLTLKQGYCILVLPLKSHPPLCLCICNEEAKSQMWKRKICSCPFAWPLMTTSKWGAQSSDFFIRQIISFWFVKLQDKKSSHCQLIPLNQNPQWNKLMMWKMKIVTNCCPVQSLQGPSRLIRVQH